MEKRYEVFVSSTFDDLQEARQEIMQALLELDCLPAGMELFPAANDDQWTLIKRVIQRCDYYIVVVGGRYGTFGPTGQSYTEMEYRYALEMRKPVIGFIHKSPELLPSKHTDPEPEKKAMLDEFRTLMKQKSWKPWDSPSDLGGKVSRSLVQLIKNDPAVGWVRADELPSEDALREIIELQRRVDALTKELDDARKQLVSGPPSVQLASGDDAFSFAATCKIYWSNASTPSVPLTVTMTWNSIFFAIGNALVTGAEDVQLKAVLESFIERECAQSIRKLSTRKNPRTEETRTPKTAYNFVVDGQDFDTIIVQLKGLGLIAARGNTWNCEPKGEHLLVTVRGIRSDGATFVPSAKAKLR